MKRLRPIMLGGSGSDVGKSVLAAGLCRIFLQDGHHPAPFKAQNMALNSYVTPNGLEIGRAQAVQAEASGTECRAEMNPVLLKPSGHMKAQVVVLGRPEGTGEARNYYGRESREGLRSIVNKAFDRLAETYNPIVMEGAGSIAELNLRERDIVNMPMAAHADAVVVLVADIDRGGIFAQTYGSIMLQPEEDRKRIKGIIINKFRGDLGLFSEGRKMIENLCGVPVVGVVPYFSDIHIEEEDSMALDTKSTIAKEGRYVNVAVAHLPHLSNFTDFDLLSRDPRVHLYFTLDPGEIGKADIIILPGTKNTLGDLSALRDSGCADMILRRAEEGARVVGICGGYQMMGEMITDPEGVEGEPGSAQGLGLLPTVTLLTRNKCLSRARVRIPGSGNWADGYEIHMGRTILKEGAEPMFLCEDGHRDGSRVRESTRVLMNTGTCPKKGEQKPGFRIWGTYLHGILDNTEIVNMLVGPVAEKKGLSGEIVLESARAYKERQYDMLADRMRECLDMDLIYKIMEEDA